MKARSKTKRSKAADQRNVIALPPYEQGFHRTLDVLTAAWGKHVTEALFEVVFDQEPARLVHVVARIRERSAPRPSQKGEAWLRRQLNTLNVEEGD